MTSNRSSARIAASVVKPRGTATRATPTSASTRTTSTPATGPSTTRQQTSAARRAVQTSASTSKQQQTSAAARRAGPAASVKPPAPATGSRPAGSTKRQLNTVLEEVASAHLEAAEHGHPEEDVPAATSDQPELEVENGELLTLQFFGLLPSFSELLYS